MPELHSEDADLDRFAAALRDDPRVAQAQMAEARQHAGSERAEQMGALRNMDLVLSNHARGADPAEQERLVRAVRHRLRRRRRLGSALLAAAVLLLGLGLGLLWPRAAATDRLPLPPGVHLRAEDQTAYRLLDDGDGVRLESGVLHCQVDPQRQPRRPWRIVTPHASAIVAGTAFTTRCADEGSLLQVTHGAVTWQHPDEQDTFTAGATAFAPGPELDSFLAGVAAHPLPDPIAIASAPAARRLLLGPGGVWRADDAAPEAVSGWRIELDGGPTQTVRLPLPPSGEQAVLRLACAWPAPGPLRLRYEFFGQLHRVDLPLSSEDQGAGIALGTMADIDLLLRLSRARTTALGPWYHLRYRLGQALRQRFVDLGALEHIAITVSDAKPGTVMLVTGAWVSTP